MTFTNEYMRASALFVMIAAVFMTASCVANQTVLEAGKSTPGPTATERVDTFETDIADVKRAEFTWVFVIRRRDGGVLDTADKALVRDATAQANRRVLSDAGKAIIVGSNFKDGITGIEPLKKQFEVTDLSPPPIPGGPQINSNAAQQQ
jgi:hypothetical protein